MLTYGEIISQVASRLGYKVFENALKENLSQAVNWAEHELLDTAMPSQRLCTIKLKSTTDNYSLSNFGVEDFGSQVEIIIFDSNNNKFDVVEVPHDKWLRYDYNGVDSNTNESLPDSSASSLSNEVEELSLSGKLVVSLRYDPEETGRDADYVLCLKPAVDGTAQIRYNIIANRDIFKNLSRYPRVPVQFHHFVIPGAVKFLSEIEAANAMQKGNQAAVNFFLTIQERASAEFRVGIARVQQKKEVVSQPVVIEPFVWYDNLRKYKNA